MRENQKSSKRIELIKLWLKCIGLTLLLYIAVVSYPILISGNSMDPTLKDTEIHFVKRLAYSFYKEPKRGDIIVFEVEVNGEPQTLVKRVIGQGLDSIKIHNNRVYINEKPIDEPYTHGSYTRGDLTADIPGGFVFVMGDNREESADSRHEEIGLITESQIIGKLVINPFQY